MTDPRHSMVLAYWPISWCRVSFQYSPADELGTTGLVFKMVFHHGHHGFFAVFRLSRAFWDLPSGSSQVWTCLLAT